MIRNRILVVALGLAAAAASVLGLAADSRPAEAASFNGWTYDVSVGSTDGLRLTDVFYDGTKIFDRISLPVMNVYYQSNRCGPYTDKLGGSSYTGPFGSDFTQGGVRWRSIGLTDRIGAYEITMVYYLSENGDFDAHMFSRGLQCNVYHEHLPFWRMDFDLAGVADDQVFRSTGNGSFAQESREFSLGANAAVDHGWEVRDAVTGDRVTIAFDNGSFTVAGQVVPETDYENNKVFGRQYRSNETTWQGGPSRGLFGDNDETMTDLVLWYSGYMPHSAAEGETLWHSTGVRLRVNPEPDVDPNAVTARFENVGCRAVEVYWEVNGVLTLYNTLDPEESYEQDTFVDDTWVFLVGSETVGTYVASQASPTYDIDSGSCSVDRVFSSGWSSSNPSGGWSYWWNEGGPLGDSSGYSSLVWNTFHFDSDGQVGGLSGDEFSYGLVAGWGVHPGLAVGQGASTDRYAIVRYTVDRDGPFSVVGSSLANRGCVSAGVDVVVLVNDSVVRSLSGVTSGSFDSPLGTLAAGDRVDVAVGPGVSSVCDAYDLDFTITGS